MEPKIVNRLRGRRVLVVNDTQGTVCSAAIRTLSELQGYLTEHGVVIVLKPFTIHQLEEAVAQAVGTEAPGAVRSLDKDRRDASTL